MESWSNKVTSEDVMSQIDKGLGPKTWSPIFKELIKCTPPNSIVNFDLLWRDPQPSWTSPHSRVIQIGDSAHTFLPASGNGATQAIEDAISLASCLQLGGKDKIEEAVQAHVRFRFTRVVCAQKLGFANAEILQDTDWERVPTDPKKAHPRHPKWTWEHDVEKYTYENYEENVEAMKEGVRFDESHVPPNYPPGYRYEPWSIDDIMERMKKGESVDLGSGDWR